MTATLTTDWVTAIASVLAAVGTFAAVAFSLWVTLGGRRHRVGVESSMAVNVGGGPGATFQHVVTVSNGGDRPAWITLVTPFDDEGRAIVGGEVERPKVPFTLADGESARYAWDASSVSPARVVVQVSHGPTIEIPTSRYRWQRYGFLWRRRRAVPKRIGPTDGLRKI